MIAPCAGIDAERCAAERVGELSTQEFDERMRAVFSRKLALLAPLLPASELAPACRKMQAALAVLAAEAAEQVRSAIAGRLRDMRNAPHGLILQSSHSTAALLCEPMMRLAPLLTDADLLALLAAPPAFSATTAIAGWREAYGSGVDAVAAGIDNVAVRALLSDPSAAMQEAMLDALIDQVRPHSGWRAPLARCPVLTPKAARALSSFIAADLIDALAQRDGLDSMVVAELRCGILALLHPPAAGMAPPGRGAGDEELVASVRELAGAGALDEAALLQAAQDGDGRRVAAILAVSGGLSLAVVDRTAALRNAKGLISLAWNAGFSMRAAGVAQTMLAQLGPGAVLPPGPRGAFPLSDDEMCWQLEVLVGQPA